MSESEPDYLRLINQLHDGFTEFQRNRRQIHPKKDVPHTKIAVVYGLACHADMLSREVLPLLAGDDPRPHLAAVPIVRAIYEAGLTAQWISHTPLAEFRIAKKHRDVQRQMTTELRRSAIARMDEAADRRDDWYDESQFDIPPGTPPSAGIESICTGFKGGVDLYLIYRMLCGNVHPGVEAIDPWLSGDPNNEHGVRFLTDPREQWHDLTAYVTLWGVLWSSVALDDLIKNNPRRNLLNRTSEKGQADLRLRLK